MKVFKSMIFFGGILLMAGLVLPFIIFGLTETCDSEKIGFEDPNQCPPKPIPWNFFSIYLLPGIILIGSGILLKKKNK